MNQVAVLETPIKSEGDKKTYRLIQLANGLKALLVHFNEEKNSESDDIAAVMLTIKVGSFDDPKNAMGLAHFLEHVVFMGSEKYPGENSFNEFLTANGGNDNAMTSSEFTGYYFSIAEKVFPKALDIFAHQFISPLLSKDSMQRERESVDSEYKMALSREDILIEMIHKTFINENHPASQFDCGNLKTLKEDITDDDLHAELLKLFGKYTGDKMSLAMQSKSSLDEMQALVVESFSSIKSSNNGVTRKHLSVDEIFKPEFYSNMIFMKPKTAIKKLEINWTFPSVHKYYKSSPMTILTYIFGNDGVGGLKKYLKERQLITQLSFFVRSNSFDGNSEFSMPKISITVTDQGAENVEEILEAIFSYLLMIQDAPIEEIRRLFNDVKEQADLRFKFHKESSALSNVQSFARSMLIHEDIDIIKTLKTFIKFDENAFIDVISRLNQRKFNLTILNADHGNFPKKTKFFEADYDEVPFPERYQKLWDERKLNPEFFLEQPNPFKASNFEIYVNEAESPKFPVKIFEDEILDIWHKLDNKFLQPRVIVSVQMLSHHHGSSIQSFLFMTIYDYMLTKHLDQTYSLQSSAGLDVTCTGMKKYLGLTFKGYNDRMMDFIDLVIRGIKTFNESMDQSHFETIKNQERKSYFNRLLEADNLDNDNMKEIINSDYYHDLELYKGIDTITFENLQKFIVKFFQNMKIKVLVQGNMTKDQALNVGNILKTNFDCEPLLGDFKLKGRSYQIPLGTNVFRVKSLMPNDDNSEIRNYYEIGSGTLRTRSLTKLLVSILHPKAFDYLRNKEQLGYTVGCAFDENQDVIGIKIKVSSQEHKHHYSEILQKMDIFMNDIAKTTIQELSDDEFESFKQARIKALLADEKTLEEENSYSWSEISRDEFVFNRSELAAKVTKALTKQNLQEHFESFTKPENMRKLSVQVIGNKVVEGSSQEIDTNSPIEIDVMTEKLTEDENLIENIEEFQKNLVLHPMVKFAIE